VPVPDDTRGRQAGRTADAITIFERVAADTERILCPEHPDTLAAVDALRESKRRPRPAAARADVTSER